MQRYNLFFICFFILTMLTTGCKAAPFHLVSAGKTDYVIVLPDAPSKSEEKAAGVLSTYLKKATGATFNLVKEANYKGDHGIFIGRTKAGKNIGAANDKGEEGYNFYSDEHNVYICGRGGHGTEYGVYYFLEQYAGCRKYDAGPAYVPSVRDIQVPGGLKEKNVPSFIFRQAYYPMSNDAEYLNWHGLHKFEDIWGLWGHSFFKLLPPSEYFKAHPEYYALVNGQRRATQLCLSNPQVLALTIAKLKAMMADNPDAEYWSVSPNDEGGNCTCELCAKADAEDGGPSGSLVRFVNKVAAAFPAKRITTLGYGYTSKSPKVTRPADNVYILVSSIDAFREQPLAEAASAATFRKDLDAWASTTNNIFVWDYATQFTNYLAPFPDQHMLAPNFQYFLQHHVKGIFEQGSGDTYSDIAELNSYIQAKLLWNTSLDPEALSDEFCKGYYGKAGSLVLQYLAARKSALIESKRHLDIYGNPVTDARGYLAPEHIARYDQFLEQAEAAVAGTPFAQRVQRIRLSLDYVVLQQSRHFGVEQYGFLNPGAGLYTVKENWPGRVSNFVAAAKAAGVTELAEGGLNPAQYEVEWQTIFSRKWAANPVAGAAVNLQYPFVEDYYAKGNRTLTDGMTGFNDFSYNWLCFYGNDLVATIDAGKEIKAGTIKLNFLDDQRHWIFTPTSVDIELSQDGKTFSQFKSVTLPAITENTAVNIVPVAVTAPARQARYIRVTAHCPAQLPAWRSHPTKKPMIACDEIFVLP